MVGNQKELWTKGDQGSKYFHADDEGDEAKWVTQQLRELQIQDSGWQDMAIFYRTNAQSRVLEEHS